jgi:hypothetical protein
MQCNFCWCELLRKQTYINELNTVNQSIDIFLSFSYLEILNQQPFRHASQLSGKAPDLCLVGKKSKYP